MLANSEDDSLTSAVHDDGILEQDTVGVVVHVVFSVLVAGLLLSQLLGTHLHVLLGREHISREERKLVNLHVHLLKEHAIGWNAVTLSKEEDVTDDNFPVEDCLASACVATEHVTFVILDFILKKQELLLLAPIAESLDETSEENGKEDRDCVDKADRLGEEAKCEAGNTKDDQHLHVEFVKLILQDDPE